MKESGSACPAICLAAQCCSLLIHGIMLASWPCLSVSYGLRPRQRQKARGEFAKRELKGLDDTCTSIYS